MAVDHGRTPTANAHRSCTDCPLHAARTQVVLADPPTESRLGLFAVGEAPGRDEDLQGVGFVGSAGKTLDRLLAAHGITRSMYGRANICSCRPPGNRKPSRMEMDTCELWLRNALLDRFPEPFSARVVLAVGGTPAARFYEGKSLSAILNRAARQDYVPDLAWARDRLRVIPMPHTSPLAFNRNAPVELGGVKWKQIAERQIQVLVGMLD